VTLILFRATRAARLLPQSSRIRVLQACGEMTPAMARLFSGLLVSQYVAGFGSGGGIDRYVPFIDVLNDPVLIDYKGSTIPKALRLIKNAVIPHDCSFEIAQQGKRDTDVLREAFVGGNTIYTDAEDLRVHSFEFGDISLIRLQLFRSTTGKGQNVKSKHYVLLAFEIA
jgi:hypothetical protein